MPRKIRQRSIHLELLEARRYLTAYFVSVDGTDDNSGLVGHPWATLQYAANQIGPGDTVSISPGEYSGFDLGTDGSAAQRIVFSADPGVVITSANSRTPDGINLEGADYVTIEGFEVTGVDRAGIRSVVNTDVVIRNNHVHDNGRWGIFTGFSENLLIEDNEASGSQIEHGIYVSNSADEPTVRGNLVWGNAASGIQLNADASLGGDGIIKGALIDSNTIYDNGRLGGAAINLDGIQESVVQNNLLYNNHASGIALFQIDGAEGSANNVVVNNTIHQADDGRWALLVRDASTGNQVHNNILLSQHPSRGSIDISVDSTEGLASDFNVVLDRFTTDDASSVIDLAAWRAQTGQDANSQVANAVAVFTDWPAADFTLSDGSPARDAGAVSLGPAVDIIGTLRGSSVDVGAFERVELLPGDFDSNGEVNALDIDQLYVELREGSNLPEFDLNADRQLNQSDMDVLVRDILGTEYGDVDLDGDIDTADRTVLTANWSSALLPGNGSRTWAMGNFDDDQDVDTADQTLLVTNWTGASMARRTSSWLA